MEMVGFGVGEGEGDGDGDGDGLGTAPLGFLLYPAKLGVGKFFGGILARAWVMKSFQI
jgi:hypothetical protein